MSRASALVLFSLAAHAALGLFIGEIEVKKSHAATAIAYAESRKKQAEPAKVDPAPPPPKAERARPVAHRAPAAAPPSEAPQPNKPAPNVPVDSLPDFGLSLSGSANGTGIALPAGAGAGARPNPLDKVVVKKKPVALAAPAERAVDCDEPASKPRPISVPQPPYSEQARAAQIEGKVRVQITVDESGNVVDVKLVQGLGHGLDEAALAAARAARFEPALQCGKPVRATFNIGMRFTL